MFLKNIVKLTESYICRRFFSDEFESCRLKRDSGPGAFLLILLHFKNNYLVVHVRTAAPDILGYPYVEISSTRFTLKKCTVFSRILEFIHFKLILESCTTSEVYLEQYYTSMMKPLAVVFSQKHSIIDIWQGSKYGSAVSFFNIFPLSLFGYLNEYMNIFFFLLKVWSYFAHVTKIKNIARYFIGSQTICFYIDHGNTKFSYIYTIEKRKSSL